MSTTTCAVAGCGNAALTRGLCAKHYHRLLRYGDPEGRRTTSDERFWARVDRAGGADACWHWLGPPSLAARGQLAKVYRQAYALVIGPIPPGHRLLATCADPRCINPAHRRLVPAEPRQARPYEWVTRCPQGHPYDEANTYRRGRKRRCRICMRAQHRAYYARKKAAEAAGVG